MSIDQKQRTGPVLDENGCWSPEGSLDWSAAALVRRLRLMRGWTQRELAARAEVAQSHVAKVEAGGNVRLTTVERLVEAMGCRLLVRVRPVTPLPVR